MPEVADLQQARMCSTHGSYVAERVKGLSGNSWWRGCPVCLAETDMRRETERAAAAQHEVDEAEFRAASRRTAFLCAAGLIDRWEHVSFDTFKAEKREQRAALETCRAYATNVNRGSAEGLLLLGPVGTGKTHLVLAVLRHLLLVRGWEGVESIGARDLIREIRLTWQRGSASTESEVLDHYIGRPMLAIDDLGAGLGSESEQAHLLDVIDGRYQALRPTLITSNLNLPQLREAIGERAIDRLQEGARVVVCKWGSFRKPKAGDRS